MLFLVLEPKDLGWSAGESLVEMFGRVFRDAEANSIRGAFLGAASGLLVGGLIMTFVGRHAWSLVGIFVVMTAGGIYGALHEASPLEMGWTMVILGGAGGALGGALLGALLGAIIGASSGGRARF
jgi:hypothetical protein